MAITGINGEYIGNGVGGFIDFDIVNGRVLSILSSGSLGLYATALVENPGQVRAGTVVYRKTEMIKTGSFAPAMDDGTGGIATQAPQVLTVLVNLDTYLSAKYKLDDFDMAGVSQIGEIEAQIALGLSKATMARLDAELFEHIKTFLKTAPASSIITIPDFSTTTAIEDMRLNRLKLNDLIADIESQINPQMVGTEEFNTTTIMNKKAYGRFLEGIAQSGGSLGTELRLGGQIPGQLIGGNAILKHIFIGKNVDATVLTLDKVLATDYDFSKIEALLWSKDAIAYPTDFVSVSSMKDYRDGNIIFIQKFRYGFKVLRPELIRAIVNAPITAKSGDAPKSISEQPSNDINEINSQKVEIEKLNTVLAKSKDDLKKIAQINKDKAKELADLNKAIELAKAQITTETPKETETKAPETTNKPAGK